MKIYKNETLNEIDNFLSYSDDMIDDLQGKVYLDTSIPLVDREKISSKLFEIVEALRNVHTSLYDSYNDI